MRTAREREGKLQHTHIFLPKRPDCAPQLAEDILTRRFSNLEYDDQGPVFVTLRDRGGGGWEWCRVEAERDSRFLREIVGIEL